MRMDDRIFCSLFGLVAGALLGVVCWWLYGMGMSVHYTGAGLDPLLKHWVTWLGFGFAAVGFVFRVGVGDAIGLALAALLESESDRPLGREPGLLALLLMVVIVVAAWWWVP